MLLLQTMDTETQICCLGGLLITLLTVGSIVFIVFFYGVAGYITYRLLKYLGISLKKDK